MKALKSPIFSKPKHGERFLFLLGLSSPCLSKFYIRSLMRKDGFTEIEIAEVLA